jgi:maltose alpha-D-glucosyltransferase/alpha-amylase
VTAYRDCPELAWGRFQVLDPGPDAAPVLAHRCDDEVAIVVLHNLGDARITARPVLDGLAGGELYEVFPDTGDAVHVGDDGRVTVELPPYGCRWLRSAR